MTIPQLLVHDKKDTVGVVVVEGLKAGTDMLCVVTADDSSFKLGAKMDVKSRLQPRKNHSARSFGITVREPKTVHFFLHSPC